MLKFLLIIAISIYVLSKLGRLLFGIRMSSTQNRSFNRSADGSINNTAGKEKNKPTVKGGEYIDFEEIK